MGKVKDWAIETEQLGDGMGAWLDREHPDLTMPRIVDPFPVVDIHNGKGSLMIRDTLVRIDAYSLPYGVEARITCPHCGRDLAAILQVFRTGCVVARIACRWCNQPIRAHTEIKIDVSVSVSIEKP